MRIPSVKTLSKHWPTQAKAIRQVMEDYYWDDNTDYYSCHPSFKQRDYLEKISKLINGFGCEDTKKGSNQKSPAIKYVNMGDGYETTILFINGNFSVGCWGYFVERGNYS